MSGAGDILDAHVHLYDPQAVRYDWLAGTPSLNTAHPPERYWAEAEAAGIGTLVWVEVNAAPGEYLREARHVARWANEDPRIVGQVVSVPSNPMAGDFAGTEGLMVLPRLAGVRMLIETHAGNPGWAARPEVAREVRRITGQGARPFDLCLRAEQIPEAAELVARCPEVTFVLDHCGKPVIGGAAEGAWRGSLSRLATRRNVLCKLSGLGTEIVAGEVSAARTVPFLRHALEAFGPARCMFGSDWPICRLAFSLGEWVATVRDVVAPGGAAALDAVFGGTARTCYGLAQEEKTNARRL
jgi:L-fuconolactonase